MFMQVNIQANEEQTEFWAELCVGKFPPIVSAKVGSLPEVLAMTSAKLAEVGKTLAIMEAFEGGSNRAH